MGRALVVSRSVGMGRALVVSGSVGMGRALVVSRSVGMGRALVVSGSVGMARALVMSGSVGMGRALVMSGSVGMGRALVVSRSSGTGPRAVRSVGIARARVTSTSGMGRSAVTSEAGGGAGAADVSTAGSGVNSNMHAPIRILAPARSGCGPLSRSPFRKVPLVEPRSSSQAVPPRQRITACRRETSPVESLSVRPAVSSRPITVSPSILNTEPVSGPSTARRSAP